MDSKYMHKTVIINVLNVGTLRIDMIYLGGTLRKVRKMSLKSLKEKARKAEDRLKLYLLKNYKKSDFVNQDKVEKLIRKYSEAISKRRLLK